MSQLVYGIVRESQRRVIHVVCVQDKILGPYELDDITERMGEKLASRGELTAEVGPAEPVLAIDLDVSVADANLHPVRYCVKKR